MQSSLLADGCYLGDADFVGPADEVFQVHLVAQVHLASAHLEDEALLPAVGQRELDLAVQTAGAQQRGVQRVGAVGGHDHLDVDALVKAVHLVEQLHQNALDLAVGARLRVEARGGNGVHLVHEDDGGRVLAREAEHVAHHARPFA